MAMERMMELCQCPISGVSHFYKEVAEAAQTTETLCQCPISGVSHFYKLVKLMVRMAGHCVNALYRAFLISTMVR